jgi:hypothetical protein
MLTDDSEKHIAAVLRVERIRYFEANAVSILWVRKKYVLAVVSE